jgi:hypothetical protein
MTEPVFHGTSSVCWGFFLRVLAVLPVIHPPARACSKQRSPPFLFQKVVQENGLAVAIPHGAGYPGERPYRGTP